MQDLIKYKDIFYDENFNQEVAKKYAQVKIDLRKSKNLAPLIILYIYFLKQIYAKYIAVSATDSIDCLKNDRLKLHPLFVSNAFAKTATSEFRPTYEDTFDSIEEFLLNSLYDEWKLFMGAEENYFNHVCHIFSLK